MKRRKVMHAITGLGRGGAEAMLYKTLARTVKSPFSPSVLSLSGEGLYGERIRGLGIPVHCLGMRPGFPDPLAFVRFHRLVSKTDPVLLHAWMYHAGLAAIVSAPNRPIILGIRHALQDWEGEARGTRFVIRALARMSGRAARIVYNSEASRCQHEEIGYCGRTGVTIPNGFDCAALRPCAEAGRRVRHELGVPPGAFVLGHLGRFHPVKDHGSLLSAFALVARRWRHMFLVMAGRHVDSENEDLRRRIKALDLVDRVCLLGARDDVPDLVNAFDVLVNCSRSEAFPNVLGEAMACGVPCIATDVGDSRFVLGPDGIIVPPGDAEALAGAIDRVADLTREERQAWGLRARARIIEKFSIEQVVDQYQALYETVLDEERSRR